MRKVLTTHLTLQLIGRSSFYAQCPSFAKLRALVEATHNWMLRRGVFSSEAKVCPTCLSSKIMLAQHRCLDTFAEILAELDHSRKMDELAKVKQCAEQLLGPCEQLVFVWSGPKKCRVEIANERVIEQQH